MAEIRRIRLDEAPIVRELYRAGVQDLADAIPKTGSGCPRRVSRTSRPLFRLGSVHDDEAIFVAEGGGELVGFVTASVSRGRSLPGVAGEIGEIWAADRVVERQLAETAVRWLSERGARAIFHTEDAARPEQEPWESLGFEADAVRFSLYE